MISEEQIQKYFDDLQNKYLQIKNADELITFLNTFELKAEYLYVFKDQNDDDSSGLEDHCIDDWIESQFEINPYEERSGYIVRAVVAPKHALAPISNVEDFIKQELMIFLENLDYEIVKNEVIYDNKIKIDNLQLCSDYERERISKFGLSIHNVIFYFKPLNIFLGASENEYSDGNWNFNDFYKVEQRSKNIVVWEKSE